MAVPAQNESMWYRMTSIQVAQELQVDPAQGLSTVEALARLKQYGPNTLGVAKKRQALDVWDRLYSAYIPITLFVAALLSFLFSFHLGTSLLLAGLAIFSILFGAYGDIKAEANSTSLEKRALVRRDGQISVIDAADVVPGDIVMLTTGSRVPADGRLYIAARLSINENTLSGGSSLAWKETAAVERVQARQDECVNMAFMNTTVTHGYGVMIVTGTGMNTKIGSIVSLSDRSETDRKSLREQRCQMTMDIAKDAFTVKSLMGI